MVSKIKCNNFVTFSLTNRKNPCMWSQNGYREKGDETKEVTMKFESIVIIYEILKNRKRY